MSTTWRTPALHVVSHHNWIADDLTTGAVRRHASSGLDIEVRHSYGFDLPSFRPDDSVWAPMEWMARAAAQDPRLRLVDPGADFLTKLPVELTGRTVELLTVADMHARVPANILDDGPDVFAKPANCKIEDFPGRWDDYEGHILHAVAAPKVPDEQLFLVTETRLDLVEEYRLFVLDGDIVASTPYLQHSPDGEVTWHEGMSANRDDFQAVEGFGHRVLSHLKDQAISFTLDVGFLTSGRIVVIEANPAWSSAFYGANTAAVVECLAAAVTITEDPDAPPVDHQWVPDPYLAQRVQQQRPLGAPTKEVPRRH